MSKTSSCIEILQVLNSRSRLVSVQELSSLLDISERNIIEYIRELKNMGYDIISMSGRYGGYLLSKKSVLPSFKLTDDEKHALMAGNEYIHSRIDFMDKYYYEKAMMKITSSMITRDYMNDFTIIYRFPLAMPQFELENRYMVINKCIADKEVLEIDYLSLSNTTSTRCIHPYKLYMYNNAWFVLGYDEKRNDIRYFKLNRISRYARTNRHFEIALYYNERNYLDEFGMKQNGEWYDISLKFTGNNITLMKERIYGRNQTIVEYDDYCILNCSMQNEHDILSFVLSFGVDCEVLEPEWLRDEVKAQCKKMIEKYR